MGRGQHAFEDPRDVVRQPVLLELGYTPPTLGNDDAIDEGHLLSSVRGNVAPVSAQQDLYDKNRPTTLYVSTLRRQYEMNDEAGAMRMLTNGRQNLVLDDNLTWASDHPNLVWNMNEVSCSLPGDAVCVLNLFAKVRLDYELRIPNEIGFASILPNVSIPAVVNWLEWTFFIDTTRAYWAYRGSREFLGFDPAENMLYIGRTSNSSDVFFTWMPKDALLPQEDCEPVEYTDTPTVMASQLRLATWALLAHVLAKSHYQDIALVVPYPDITDLAAFKAQCNILYVRRRC